MKQPPVNESDLLALVEGELSAERAEAVRAALKADAELLRKVEGMVRDRAALQREGAAISRGEGTALARGVAARAIESVERQALTTAPPVGHHRPRRRAMLIAASVGLVMLGGWGAFVVWFVQKGPPEPIKVPATAPNDIAAATSQPKFTLSSDPKKLAALTLVGPPADITDPESEESEETVATALPPGYEPFEPSTRQVNAPLLAEWMAKEKGDEPSEIASVKAWQDGMEQRVRSGSTSVPGSLTPREAAKLALEGRLQLKVTGGAKGLMMARLNALRSTESIRTNVVAVHVPADTTMAAAHPPAEPSTSPVAGPASDESEDQPKRDDELSRVHLTLRVSGCAQLIDDLAYAIDHIAAQLRELGSSVDLVEVPLAQAERESRPTLTPGDMLWWSSPIENWRPWVFVDMRIQVGQPEG